MDDPQPRRGTVSLNGRTHLRVDARMRLEAEINLENAVRSVLGVAGEDGEDVVRDLVAETVAAVRDEQRAATERHDEPAEA
jgi:hypothetical protein